MEQTEKVSQVRYLHLRRYQPVVGRDNTEEESYVVGINFCPYGGVTVAYRDLGEGNFQVGLGRCRTNERYERKLGRDAAVSNLLRGGELIHIEPSALLLSKPSDAIPDLIDYAKHKARRNLAMTKNVLKLKVKGSL